MVKPHRRPGILLQSQSENSEVGIKATLKLIKQLPAFKVSESVCCAEHTAQAALRHIQCPLIELPAQAFFPPLVRKQPRRRSDCRSRKLAVYNEVKLMLSTPSASLNMRFDFAIRCSFGNRPGP
ncbi:hypothetical protein BH09BAC4_BH09BAC4_39730 [soil metagenome]